MIEMKFERLGADDETTEQLVWLRSNQGSILLPVPIASREALLIYMHLTGQQMSMSESEDLTSTIIGCLRARVKEVRISEVGNSLLRGEIVLESRHGEVNMDVSAGDGIAVALKYGVRIYLSEEALANCGLTAWLLETEDSISSGALELLADISLPDKEFTDMGEEPDLDDERMKPYLDLPFTDDEIRAAIEDLLVETGFQEAGCETNDPQVRISGLVRRMKLAASSERYEEAASLQAEILRLREALNPR